MPISIPRDPMAFRTPNAGRISVPRDPTTVRVPNAGQISVPRPVGGGRRGPPDHELKGTIALAMGMGLTDRFSKANIKLVEADVKGQTGLDLGGGRRLFAMEGGRALVQQSGKWLSVDLTSLNFPDQRY